MCTVAYKPYIYLRCSAIRHEWSEINCQCNFSRLLFINNKEELLQQKSVDDLRAPFSVLSILSINL